MVMLVAMMSSFKGFSQQTVNDYSFIEVPELFEFLRGKDQYQLNSLTKFLFLLILLGELIFPGLRAGLSGKSRLKTSCTMLGKSLKEIRLGKALMMLL